MPREFSVASCATRILDAATIFMADVICHKNDVRCHHENENREVQSGNRS